MEEMNREGVIYMYTSPSGKKYIGQTKYEYNRKSDHKCTTINKNTHFGHALKKYGYENFEYEVIFRCKSNSKERLKIILNTMEIYFIKKYDSINNGYNLTTGGNVISVHEETKRKISEANKGKIRTEEQKSKIGVSKRKIVLQYSLQGTLIREWESITKASKQLNINDSCISRVCKGNQQTAGEFI